MPTSTFEIGERFTERGVNVFRGNTVDRDSRQSITCPPEYLLTAIDNTTATNALQCLGPQPSQTIEQLPNDFSPAKEESIDVRPADSSTPFQGTGRILHTIACADSNNHKNNNTRHTPL